MNGFLSLVCRALAQILADNLSLPEDAAQALAQKALIRRTKAICAAALDPDTPDAKALAQVRALCVQAQLFFREQGI